MARPIRKFTVSLGDNQHPVVTFEGDYINKRELDLCVRALKRKQREIIREYRRKEIITKYESEKKGQVTDDTRGTKNTESDRSEAEGTGEGAGSPEPAKTSDAGSTGGSISTSANSISGLTGKVPGAPGTASPGGKSASKDA